MLYKVKNGPIVSRPTRIGNTFIGVTTDLGPFGYYELTVNAPENPPAGQQYVDTGGTFDEVAVTYAPTWELAALPVPAPRVPTETERIAAATAKSNNILLQKQMVAELDNLSDEDLAIVSAIFEKWSPDSVAYAVDAIRTYENVLYKAVQAHTSQSDWFPPAVPALWTLYRNPAAGPQPWVQPTGAQDAYAVAEEVTHPNPNQGGASWIYRSTIPANTTIPGNDGTFDRYWTPVSAV